MYDTATTVKAISTSGSPMYISALDQRVALRVGIAGAAIARVRDEQVIEPVLRVVIVGLPAMPEDDVLDLGSPLEEGLALCGGEVDLDAQVVLPLRLQIFRNRL